MYVLENISFGEAWIYETLEELTEGIEEILDAGGADDLLHVYELGKELQFKVNASPRVEIINETKDLTKPCNNPNCCQKGVK